MDHGSSWQNYTTGLGFMVNRKSLFYCGTNENQLTVNMCGDDALLLSRWKTIGLYVKMSSAGFLLMGELGEKQINT